MGENKLPRDSIELGTGEQWRVPRLPGGMSEKAVKCREWYYKTTGAARTLHAVSGQVRIDAEKEGADLKDIERRWRILDDEWQEAVHGPGFEMLCALWRLEHEDGDYGAMFPVDNISEQVTRARVISREGEWALDDDDKEDEDDDGRSDFTEATKPTTETASGGSDTTG